MDTVSVPMVEVRISEDEMSAYLSVPTPATDTEYTVAELKNILEINGVVYGVDEEAIENILSRGIYNHRVQVATGTEKADGQDGYYIYHFKQNLDKKPTIREDGSVDYSTVNLIETVVAGQEIVTYVPPVEGVDGSTVRGKIISSKRGKEMVPLRGKGFERSEDGLHYVASTDGKIDMLNGRININNFHEIHDNIDTVFGNIDFAGDVVIHGNVCTGVSVRAGGTLTVTGIVEGANVWAGKDIVIKGGVLGDNRAEIFARGDIYAQFCEYAKIEALGMIQADSFLQCEVECRQKIILAGKKGIIIGGRVHAIEGIEVNEIGNESEIISNVEVGLGTNLFQEIGEIRKQLQELRESNRKIEDGLARFDELGKERGISYKKDPRRMALVRVSIRNTAIEKAQQARLEELLNLDEASKYASIKVNRRLFPGTVIVIGNQRLNVNEALVGVEYVKSGGQIVVHQARR